MRNKNRKSWKIRLFLFFLALLALYILNIYTFLDVHADSKPDILVVEGWLSNADLNEAAKEFKSHPYKLLITTGYPYWNGYRVGSDGKLVFHLNNPRVSADSIYSISAIARGTSCKGESAHIRVYADTFKIFEAYTERKNRDFTSKMRLDHPPDSVSVVFDNDTYTPFCDRELYVSGIIVNGQKYPVNDNHVHLYMWRMGKLSYKKHLNATTAADAAVFLKSLGIPENKLIPVETMNVNYSRTWSSAVDVKTWLRNHGELEGRSVTVVSRGPHSRRSWLSYKRAFGKDARVGVINLPDRHLKATSWFLKVYGWKIMISETAGLIYVGCLSYFW
jgi:hypothetical protein